MSLATRVIVLMSKREWITPTNTGRLASQALMNSVVLLQGQPDQPIDIRSHLLADRPSIMLYPSEDAIILDDESVKAFSRPLNLIVPDGNWRQTSKMRRRIPHLFDIPVVKVPLGVPSRYRVRAESKPEGLATIEAIARALGVLENRDVQERLESLLDIMVSRTLASRGHIHP